MGESYSAVLADIGPDAEATLSPDRWVDEHGDLLFRVAMARVSDRDTAEDLVQETFLAAWKGRREFDGRSAFATWLVSILKRKVVDHFRKCGRTPDVERCDEAGGETEFFDRRGVWNDRVRELSVRPDAAIENAEFWRVVADCVGDLPGHLAQAFQLRELDSETPAAASDQLGISRKNLSVRLHRARLLLRRCLEGRWLDQEGRKS